MGEVHFRMFDTNGFHAKAKNERFTAADSSCRHNLKYENFMSLLRRLRRKNQCTKKRAARAARLFFLIQPIKSLIFGVVVAVAFVLN